MGWQDEILKQVGRVAQDSARQVSRQATGIARQISGAGREPNADGRKAPKLTLSYPGDYPGRPPITYNPHIGKLAAPGEVVTAWVADAADARPGSVAPMLLVGRDGDWLLAVCLVLEGRGSPAGHVPIGTGAWAAQQAAVVDVRRVVRVHPEDVKSRLEKLDKARFDIVADALRGR